MRDLTNISPQGQRGPAQPARVPAPPPAPAPLLRTTVGQVLRRLRLDQGRTLADVSRAATVSMPYLSEVERGRKEASSEVLAALCAALGIGLSDLIEDVGRDLAEDQTRRAPVISLDRARVGRAGIDRADRADRARIDRQAGPGDITCLLAA